MLGNMLINLIKSSFEGVLLIAGMLCVTLHECISRACAVTTRSQLTKSTESESGDTTPLLLKRNGTQLQIRVGVGSGQAVAGVVGVDKFQYDIIGSSQHTHTTILGSLHGCTTLLQRATCTLLLTPTVGEALENAIAMEQTSLPNRVRVTPRVAASLRERGRFQVVEESIVHEGVSVTAFAKVLFVVWKCSSSV